MVEHGMTGIWTNKGGGWELAESQPFPDEATLQQLVAENPRLLPLAGSPRLFTLGREVRLGTGYADVLAVEASGRPVIIEVKLARNAEARRGIVSQVLAYAAFLHGYSVETLEQGPLHGSLAGYGSISEAVTAQDQNGAVDGAGFTAALQEHLDAGKFRLVLVLDEISSELERIVAYLDSVTLQTLTIDLITINMHDVKGVQVALPQRVSPDITAAVAPVAEPTRRSVVFSHWTRLTTGNQRERPGRKRLSEMIKIVLSHEDKLSRKELIQRVADRSHRPKRSIERAIDRLASEGAVCRMKDGKESRYSLNQQEDD